MTVARESPPNDGGSAFPSPGVVLDNRAQHQQGAYGGMSMRDYFAAKAMQGELACPGKLLIDISDSGLERSAKHYYRMADAMIKERNK